jgi:hypothetical protein
MSRRRRKPRIRVMEISSTRSPQRKPRFSASARCRASWRKRTTEARAEDRKFHQMGRSKGKQLVEAGISTTTAHRYEQPMEPIRSKQTAAPSRLAGGAIIEGKRLDYHEGGSIQPTGHRKINLPPGWEGRPAIRMQIQRAISSIQCSASVGMTRNELFELRCGGERISSFREKSIRCSEKSEG